MLQRNADTLIQVVLFSEKKISHLAMAHESQWFPFFYFLIIIIVYGNYCWAKWVPEYTAIKDLTWPSSPLEVAIAEKKRNEAEMLGLHLEKQKGTINACLFPIAFISLGSPT